MIALPKLIVELSPELHEGLKRRSAALGKTIKEMVTDLVQSFLSREDAGNQRRSGLCGSWKDSRSAAAVLEDIKSGRSWFKRPR